MKKREIWVIYNEQDIDDKEFVCQVLSKASEFKVEFFDVTAICIGNYKKNDVKELFTYGADHIVICKQESADSIVISDILESMLRQYEPALVLFLGTSLGKAAAATVSSRLSLGLTADCINIEVYENNRFLFSRATLGSSYIAKIACNHSKLQLCTIKKNAFIKQEKCSNEKGNISYFLYKESKENNVASKNIISRKHFDKVKESNLDFAKIVFGIGRGVSNESLRLLKKLADAYQAELVGTKASVDDKIIDKSRQVGQSGISICPDLYIGFGISGASQHMVGIKNAKIIVAVNKDENAPIFKYADYIIMDEVENVLQGLAGITQIL